MTTKLVQQLGLTQPIFQAPMAGGGDTPELVAAVSNAGGLGIIGAAYLTPAQLLEAARAVRAKTTRPFGINLFALSADPLPAVNPEPAKKRAAPFFAELGLDPPPTPAPGGPSFSEQVQAALESGASVFSVTFGRIPEEEMRMLRHRGLFVIGTASTVTEAVELERSGVNAVVAQGSDAGGHRATFMGDFHASMVGTMSLVPQMVDAVSVPVIASGGIMDGRGIVAALALGGQAVQMGTAFLTCAESGVPEVHKEAILNAREDQTQLTRAFSGRPARGIVNRFMQEIESGGTEAILPFPLQNVLTRPMRKAAAAKGQAEYLSLWSGQAPRLARRQTAAELMQRLAEEIRATQKTLVQAIGSI